ncbi:zinc finger CCCH domain-containing protein 48-like isoform X2 [Durio zibethinus]|uniref:Zinc finger CCCH domain-containing protein 48-like isoform X2 n=1 Tax=Durio zibethinus TaxID=66656 RepID=A0A6P5X980_DURZI|nr:zinc finger CCCH domain-containing protein 48-like isoform X2 [Durio zibethinus]
MDLDGGNRRVFNRLGSPSAAPTDSSKHQKVCYHWRAGKCTRFPCPFLHSELPHSSGPITANGSGAPKRFADDSGFSGPAPRRGPNFNNNHNNSWGRMGPNKVVRKTEKICNYWVQGNCNYGDKCRFLHSWSLGESFTMLNHLDGHQKVVSGIALPAGMDKLYTGSKDETVRAWDTNSGQCMGVIPLSGEVGCMISEGPWLFVGIPNIVKAWNTQTNLELSLSGPVGQVYAMVVGNDLLFAGTQVWSLETLQCLQTLTEHTNVVMSLLCWEQFLLSCSLDQTIKVWVATENGNLQVTYTHNEDPGLLNLRGMHDSESKPVLLCACNDNSVRLYDLPSFSERGKIFAKEEIRAIEVGPGGLFFTGDGTGFRVWKLAEPIATS